MSNLSLPKAIQSAENFRRLTNPEAKNLLEGDINKVISGTVEWFIEDTRQGSSIRARCKVEISNSLGERLYLDGRIVLDRPWQSHWILTWGNKAHHEKPATIRRLDLRDDHRNPDGQFWDRATHKHLWSVADKNRVAYTPTDIPHDPSVPPNAPDDYRAIFEAFAKEVGINFASDYRWTDPPLSTPAPMTTTLWDVP
ncbi:hypothetical protein [Kribbella steppae]|uniref:hypothetical protein n=1 Tax=Kribbella steppae TaxID=2512223 RepID=UPI00104B522E|nr:hypothetical protein [Kribbella steppae]